MTGLKRITFFDRLIFYQDKETQALMDLVLNCCFLSIQLKLSTRAMHVFKNVYIWEREKKKRGKKRQNMVLKDKFRNKIYKDWQTELNLPLNTPPPPPPTHTHTQKGVESIVQMKNNPLSRLLLFLLQTSVLLTAIMIAACTLDAHSNHPQKTNIWSFSF